MKRCWAQLRLFFSLLALWLVEGGSVLAQDMKTDKLANQPHLELRHPKDQSFWFQKAGRSSVYFYWREKGYTGLSKILTIARSCDFASDAVLHETPLVKRPYRWNTEIVGPVCWRMSVRDKAGSLVYQSKARQLQIIPDQLSLEEPSYKAGSHRFAWQHKAPPLFFRFKLSREEKFNAPIINVDQTGQSYHVEGLKPGTYYWKVGVKQAKAIPIVYSKVRTLVIMDTGTLDAPESPSLALAARAAEGQVVKDEPSAREVPRQEADKTPSSVQEPEQTNPLPDAKARIAALTQRSVPPREKGQSLRARTAPPAARPAAPSPLRPANREELALAAGESLHFTWQRADANQSTEIQVSQDPYFANFISAVVYGDTYRFIPNHGKYYWRLRTFADKGPGSQWSKKRSFTVGEFTPQIHLSSPLPGEQWAGFRVKFAWEDNGSDCQLFQLRWAMNEDFSKGLKTLATTDKERVVELDESGTYFWIVNCLEPTRALRSSVQMFEVKDE